MNRVIGEISTQVESIIHGDHRIVTSIPLADGQTGFNSRTREGATFPEGGVSGFQKFQFTHP